MTKNNMGYAFAALFVMVGAVVTQPPKTYPVSHTEAEWAHVIYGIEQTQLMIHQSNLPASQAFWCDSALQAQKNDIYGQVTAGIKSDTTGKSKGGKP